MMIQPELGKTVSALRKKKKLTQSELAESCKVSLRTIQRIEQGEVTPRMHTEKTILTFLEFELENDSNTWFEQCMIHLKELFNLKTNTMKKVTILSSITIVPILILTLLLSSRTNAQSIEGWFLSGDKVKSYTIGLDKSTFVSPEKSAYLKSKDEKIDGFGTLMQTCSADEYLGKRVRMSGYIKTQNAKSWVGMWFRVDSKAPRETLEFDNMYNRPIKGTTKWKKYEIVLDVPKESGGLAFGVLLDGTGKVWFDKVNFEIVDKSVPTTATKSKKKKRKKPSNLDF